MVAGKTKQRARLTHIALRPCRRMRCPSGRLLALQCTAGLGNYIHWTIQFAAQRRLPGFSDMLGVYRGPSLLWMLPSVAAGLLLLHSRTAKALGAIAAFTLLAAPFLLTVFAVSIRRRDDRTTVCSRCGPCCSFSPPHSRSPICFVARSHSARFLPLILLAAIHGTLLSQQLWGSTYGIWPLLILLVAELLVFLEGLSGRARIAVVCACAGSPHLHHVAGLRRLLHGQRRAAYVRELS